MEDRDLSRGHDVRMDLEPGFVPGRAHDHPRVQILAPSRASSRRRATGPGLTLAAALRNTLALDIGPDVVAVHARDEVEADLLRADRLALAVAGAGAEALLVHLGHHR